MGKKKKEQTPEPTLIELIEARIDDAAALGDVDALSILSEGLRKAAFAARERHNAVVYRLEGRIQWAQEKEETCESSLNLARKLLTE